MEFLSQYLVYLTEKLKIHVTKSSTENICNELFLIMKYWKMLLADHNHLPLSHMQSLSSHLEWTHFQRVRERGHPLSDNTLRFSLSITLSVQL